MKDKKRKVAKGDWERHFEENYNLKDRSTSYRGRKGELEREIRKYHE